MTARHEAAVLDAAVANTLFSAAREAAYAWNIETDALAWSANASAVLGIDSLAAAANGKSFAALLHPESPANRYDVIADSSSRDEGAGRILRTSGTPCGATQENTREHQPLRNPSRGKG